MTITDHRPAADPAPATRPAYDPTPSIPRLLTELVQEEFWTRYAHISGTAHAFRPDYIAGRRRTALLLRAVIADLVALADPADAHHAAQAAAAANALRRADWRMQLPAPAARIWLRQQYQQHTEDRAPHPPNCPGGCQGSGWTLEPIIWQNDGAPVHAEPVTCRRGEDDDPHGPDCTGCRGTGRQYTSTRSEFSLCPAYTPNGYQPTAPQHPHTATPGQADGYLDEPPF
ncbi:hypothetical protein ABT390_33880 [Streptomyces aurantiacus]|uniref:Uncharacterized protein n=1 Tax=Streptomyces aurantiacus JA 4570 TaxID=1286094 RepID=S4AZX6_9ACTN|nr:hypothetical protein [Streptomyces aurantiacus]EPH46892.1 hypothetical protein STRAU_0058 [Streptomyces aurantiacus JA 4570]